MRYSLAVCVAVAAALAVALTVVLALWSHKGSAAPPQSGNATIAQGLGSALSPQSENAIVEFFRNTVEIYKVHWDKNLNIMLRFLATVKVPNFQSHLQRGRHVQRTGSLKQKRDYFEGVIVDDLYKLESASLNPTDLSTYVSNLNSLLKDLLAEQTKIRNKFVEAATAMKAELSLCTVALEQDLISAITEYKAADFKLQESLLDRILTFKNRH